MSELRLNLVTREWVVIATERAKRPTDFKTPYADRPGAPAYLNTCPFCIGNEHRTAEEFFRVVADGGWRIRVVANRYPALSGAGDKKRVRDVLKRTISGIGAHEVIIESPVHNQGIATMELEEIEDIIRVYRGRFVNAHREPSVEHVIIFKNQGESAGTSILHPHSQIIATPVVPLQFRDRVQAALHYYDDTGECLICSIIKSETHEGVRVVMETERFITLIPYAALSPFHTWVFPKRHQATFSEINEDEVKEAAVHLKKVLSKFYYSLDNPDYNYVIRSSRPEDRENEYCHWYISIVPRLTQTAGFELGTGMYINTALPEESAAFLRAARSE
jgi:UDPglucose--hexose-1-phosphate uridylyltransferase